MKKRKFKKIVFACLGGIVAVVLLVTAIAVGNYWYSPYPRHVVLNKEPKQVETYFDFPDEILLYTKGKTKVLSQKTDVFEVYTAFYEMLGDELIYAKQPLNKTPHTDEYLTKTYRSIPKESDNVCVEFRYYQRRSCEINGESWEFRQHDRQLQYDATMVIVYSQMDYIFSCISLDGKYSVSKYGPHLQIKGDSNKFLEYVYSLY